MCDTLTVLERIRAGCRAGRRAALAVVTERRGSAPRGPGAMLLLDQNGISCGTVGGGSLEHEVVRELRRVLADGAAMIREFELQPERFGMPCGGRVKLLLAPVRREDESLFSSVLHRLEQGQPCTIYAMVKKEGEAVFELEAPAGWAEVACGIALEPPPGLIIFGAGHIARALAPMALAIGYGVTVVDDRPEYADAGLFSGPIAALPVASFDRCLSGLPVNKSTALLIATYGHQHDLTVLEQALATDAGYIGMIGSRRKRDEVFARLRSGGLDAGALSRVRCPMGLEIGAETPAEIAVSILAEMIASRRLKP